MTIEEKIGRRVVGNDRDSSYCGRISLYGHVLLCVVVCVSKG